MKQVAQTSVMATEAHAQASVGVRLPTPNRLLFFALGAMFVIFNTIFEPGQMPAIPLPGGAHLYLQDFLLWLLVIAALFSGLSHSQTAISSPLSKYVVFFVFIVVAEAIYSVVVLNNPLFAVYNDSKILFYYLLFFPMIWCFGTDKGIDWIIRLWAVLAIFGALLYIYQFFFGELAIFQKYDWLYSKKILIDTGGAAGVVADYGRIFSQGTVLFRIMLFVAFCMWLFPTGRKRHWWGLLALLLAFQVLLQFTRGMYITTILALLAMPFLVRERAVREKIRNVVLIGVVAIAMIIFYKTLISGGGSAKYSLLEFIWERFSRAVTEYGQDASLQDRVKGTTLLFREMDTRGGWLFGLGFGNGIIYGDNTYVSLLIKTGWIGTLVFIVLFGHACLRALRRYRYLVSPLHKALMLALLVSTVRHLANGYTQSDFAVDTRIPALIISVAMMEILGARAVVARSRKALGP